jgi:murein DD-endopeptidase MepM/ murein hydrolase activator NlpD
MSRIVVGALALLLLTGGPDRAHGQVAPPTSAPSPQTEDASGDDDGSAGLDPVDPALLDRAAHDGERAAAIIRARIRELAMARVDAATGDNTAAVAALERATTQVLARLGELQQRGAELDQLQFSHRQVLTAYDDARRRLARHATVLYTRNPHVVIANDLLRSGDLGLARLRTELIRAILEGDRRDLLDTYTAAASSDPDIEERARALRDDSGAMGALISEEDLAAAIAASAGATLAEVEAMASDWVFPVAGDHSFIDTFLAPRMVGTSQAHRHQGTDVFAEPGTPLVAVERGVVGRVGEVGLGGLRVWLIGESGTNYYYAHLSGFAPDAVPGRFVEAGTVLGFVGNTGNAVGTPPHVHFQVHPDGGRAVNPYPLLRQGADLAAADG